MGGVVSLHSLVVPNSGWIAILVAVSEFVIGWLGVDGLVASYRHHHRNERGLHTPIRQLRSCVAAGTPAVEKAASPGRFPRPVP